MILRIEELSRALAATSRREGPRQRRVVPQRFLPVVSDASTVVAEVGGRSKRSSMVGAAPLQPQNSLAFIFV